MGHICHIPFYVLPMEVKAKSEPVDHWDILGTNWLPVFYSHCPLAVTPETTRCKQRAGGALLRKAGELLLDLALFP